MRHLLNPQGAQTASDGFMINISTFLLNLCSRFTATKPHHVRDLDLELLVNPPIGLDLTGETMITTMDEEPEGEQPEGQGTEPEEIPEGSREEETATTTTTTTTTSTTLVPPLSSSTSTLGDSSANSGWKKMSEYFFITLYSIHVGVVPCLQYYHHFLQHLSREMQKMKKLTLHLAAVCRRKGPEGGIGRDWKEGSEERTGRRDWKGGTGRRGRRRDRKEEPELKQHLAALCSW
jgi:hypothetical protein